MLEVLQGYLHKFVLVYIDEILYSQTMVEHYLHVSKVLQCFWDFHLYLKAENCTSSVKFIGYNISKNRTRWMRGRWQLYRIGPLLAPSKNSRDSYDSRHFFKNLSAITIPFTSLIKNSPKTLSWNSTAAQAMNTFKKAFTAPCSFQS